MSSGGGGGLGIRSFLDTREAFIFRKCWNLVTTNSLWPEFMRVKYGCSSNLLLWNSPSKCSMECREMLERNEEFGRLITMEEDERVIWNLVESGVFTTKSAWMHV